MVGRVNRLADVEKFRAFGERVAVEQDFFIAAFALAAAIERMLAAVAIALEISEGAVRRRRVRVVFLDAPAHFGDERLSQGFERRHHAVAIGVFRLEQRGDVLGQGATIAQHLAPVLRREP